MKLARALTLIGLATGAVAAVNQGCGGDEDDGGPQAGRVPPAEEGAPAPQTPERTFAVNQIWLGETDRSGVAKKDAWRTYGYDLDGRITNVTDQSSPDLGKVCQRVQGARPSIHQDGEQGIDNAFGKEILGLLASAQPNPSRSVNDAIQAGDFTIMLKIVGLTDEPEQTNTGLSGTVLVGGAFSDDPNVRPTFAPTESWPYLADPQVPLTGAYINKGVFVNGREGAQIRLSLSFGGQSLGLTVNKAIVTFKHNPATQSLEDGTIAGVIRTDEFVNGIGQIAGSFGLCEGTTVDGIKNAIRQNSDMLVDGAQDPARTCDGISIAIGFTAKQIGAPTTLATPSPPGGDPCSPDAGGDGGT